MFTFERWFCDEWMRDALPIITEDAKELSHQVLLKRQEYFKIVSTLTINVLFIIIRQSYLLLCQQT